MPNIASVLRQEINRLVRKQLRSETESLRKACARYRADMAALKRRIDALEKQASHLAKMASQVRHVPAADPETAIKLRFKPQGVRAQRARLGLSAAEMGVLIGVSGQTVYNWEAGTTRPRAEQLEAIAAVRRMGKREARIRLAEAQPG